MGILIISQTYRELLNTEIRNGRYNKNPLDQADKAESRGFLYFTSIRISPDAGE